MVSMGQSVEKTKCQRMKQQQEKLTRDLLATSAAVGLTVACGTATVVALALAGRVLVLSLHEIDGLVAIESSGSQVASDLSCDGLINVDWASMSVGEDDGGERQSWSDESHGQE